MVEALIGVGAAFVVQFGLIWWRLGRLEGKLDEHCRRSNGNKCDGAAQ